MATTAPNSQDQYDEDGSILGGNLGGLLGAVLGTSTETETGSTQNTTGTSTQAQTGSSNQTQTGSLTGNTATTGASTGTNNTTGSSTQNQTATGNTAQNQNTSGTTAQNTTGTNTTNSGVTGATTSNNTTTGATQNTQNQTSTNNTTGSSTQNTTGTVSNSQTNNTITNQNQQTSADLAALRSVFERQQAGMTPEMLAAIFREGSKAAPGILTAQSNALGARAGNNTAVASALNMLNGDMLSQSANLSRQMLADAGGTAGKIGELTRNVKTTGNDTTTSNNVQTQNLQTTVQNQETANQILQAVMGGTSTQNQVGSGTSTQNTNAVEQIQQAVTGSSNQNQATTGSSTQNTAATGTNTQNQTTAGTSTQNQNTSQNTLQNTAGTTAANTSSTQNQQVAAQQLTQQQQTVNKSIAQNLGGLLAAGVGINEVLKVATGQGFVGNAQQLISYLKGAAESFIGGGFNENYSNEGSGSVPIGDLGGSDAFNGSNWFEQWQNSLDPAVTGSTGDWGDEWWMNPGIDWEGGDFADGGMIEAPDLTKVTPLIANAKAVQGMGMGTILALLDAVGLTSGSSRTSSGGGTTTTTPKPGTATPGTTNPEVQIGGGNVSAPGMGGGVGIGGQNGIGEIPRGDTGIPAVASNPAAEPEQEFGSNTGETVPGTGINKDLANGITGIAAGLIGVNPILGMVLKPFISSSLQKLTESNVKQVNDRKGEFTVSDVRAVDPLKSTNLDGMEDVPSMPTWDELTTGTGTSGIGTLGPGGDGGIDLDFWSQVNDLERAPQIDPEDIPAVPALDLGASFGGWDAGGGDWGGGGFGESWGDSSGGGWGDDDDLSGGSSNGLLQTSKAADGGLQSDKDADDGGRSDLLEALGICEDDKGIHFSKQSKKLLLRSLGAPMKAAKLQGAVPGMNDGGKIVGPGTGISDSIPAKGPNGQLHVANGEYIISADVVQKLGVGFFDGLQEKYHVPADMQRAITGER